MWLYKRSLKSIHEYLADQAVLKSGAEKVNYCQLLVKQTTGFHLESLTNSFYYPSLKNRIMMMTKTKNNKKNMVKLCFSLPVFALLIGVFACNDTVIKKIPADEFTKQHWPDYIDNPYHPAVFKGGGKGVAKCFLSAIDFNNWKTIITDQTSIKISLGINESGKVERVGINYEHIFVHQTSKDDFNFDNHFKKMGDWKPATTKEGTPIKSLYTFEAADILRDELKRRGLKIYTQNEADKYSEKFHKRVEKLHTYMTESDQLAKYKNGDKNIADYFLSKLDFSKWKSKITDKSVIQCSFWINESGAVDNVEFEFINQGNYVDTDFRIDLSKMGDWSPALKNGKPIKSLYAFDGGDALREAMKKRGLKMYTVEEFLKLK